MAERADDKCYDCGELFVGYDDYDEIFDFENKLKCSDCCDKPKKAIDYPWYFFSYERLAHENQG